MHWWPRNQYIRVVYIVILWQDGFVTINAREPCDHIMEKLNRGRKLKRSLHYFCIRLIIMLENSTEPQCFSIDLHCILHFFKKMQTAQLLFYHQSLQLVVNKYKLAIYTFCRERNLIIRLTKSNTQNIDQGNFISKGIIDFK